MLIWPFLKKKKEINYILVTNKYSINHVIKFC